MTQKAKSLKDIFNLFKPKALTGEQVAFYQKTAAVRDGANREFHDSLYSRIVSSDTHERLLIVGHGGCGKSTELLMLMAKLTQKNMPVVIVEAINDLDLYNFSFIDIFVRIVERMVQYAIECEFKINKNIIKAFQKSLTTKSTEEYWKDDTEFGADGSISAKATIPFYLKAILKINSSLKMASGFKEELRQEIKPKIHEVIASLNALIDDLSTQASQPITLIIDGLEKCRQEPVRKLFVEDIAFLAGIQAHLVIACPIGVYRSADAAVLSSYFKSPVVIPMIKTHHQDGSLYSEGVEVIRDLVEKRVGLSFFEDGVLNTIITKAGGSLRDTCLLLSESAFQAFMRNRTTVDMDSVAFTMKNFANDLFFRIKADLYSRTKLIYEGDLEAKADEELSELLYSGAVFEYNGDRWVDLHPLVRDYFKEHPGVLDWKR